MTEEQPSKYHDRFEDTVTIDLRKLYGYEMRTIAELVQRDALETALMAMFNYSELGARQVLLDEMKKGFDMQTAFANIQQQYVETGEYPPEE